MCKKVTIILLFLFYFVALLKDEASIYVGQNKWHVGIPPSVSLWSTTQIFNLYSISNHCGYHLASKKSGS